MTDQEALERALEDEQKGTLSEDKRAALDTLRRLGKLPRIQQTQPAPDALATTGQYVWDKAKGGLAQSLGFIGGGPVDIAHSFLGGPSVPGAPHPVSVEDIVRGGYKGLLGVQDIAAPSKNAEIAGKGAEVIGGSLPFSLWAAGGQARPLLGLFAEAGSVAGQAGGKMLGALAAEPTTELGIKYGLDPRKVGGLVERTAETVGAFSPLIGSYAVAKGVKKGEDLIGGWRSAGKRQASKELSEALTFPGVEQNLARAAELQSNLGMNFDLAQATGSPALRVIARNVAEHSPQSLQASTYRELENQRALEAAKARQIEVPVEEGLAPAQQYGLQLEKKFKTDEDIIREQYSTLTRSTVPSREPSEVGAELRGIIDTKYDQVDQKFSKAYDELATDAARAGLKIDMSEVVNYVKQRFGTDAATYQRPDMPSVFRQIYEKHIAQESDGVTSFNEFRSLMKEAAKDQRLSKGRADFAPGYLKELNDQLRTQLDTFANSGDVPAEFSGRLKAINSSYRQEVVDIYKKGVVGRLRQEGRFGEAVKDEDIVSKQFFKPNSAAGSATAMQDYMRMFGNDPNAAKLLEEGVLNVLTGPTGVLKDGLVDAAKVKAFRDKYKNAISQNPLLAKRLDTVGSISELIAEKNARMQASLKQFNESAFATIIGKNPDEAIAAAIKNPDEMTRIVSLAKTERSKLGLVSGLAKHIYKQKDPYAFLKENEKTLQPLFNALGPGHWKNVVDIAEANDLLARNPAAQRVVGHREWDWLQRISGISTSAAGQRVRAVRHGRSSLPTEATSVAVELLSKRAQRQYRDAMESAIFNPDLANTIASITRMPSISSTQMNDIKRHLLSAGLRSYATEDYIP